MRRAMSDTIINNESEITNLIKEIYLSSDCKLCNSAHLKLELDSFVFSLPLNRTFSHDFGFDGYSGLCSHLPSLAKNESRIAADVSLSVMDSVCQLLKLLHMVV
jgi:hypothetical protein